MRGIPAIWFALIVLALLSALTFWIDRAVQPPQPKRDGSTRHDPDYIISHFASSRADRDGNPRFSLAGVEMRHYPDDDSTELARPVFTQFSFKKPTTRIEGQRGQVSANGENVYFMDNVKIVRAATHSKGELTVLTEYLHIVPDQDFLQTDRPVIILQAPRTVIHGNGMEYYKKEGVLKLFGNVKVHYERPDAPTAPPLKIEQVTGLKAKPAPVVNSNREFSNTQMAVVKKASRPVAKAPAKSQPRKKKTVKKPVTKAGKTRTRIRRQYANQAN
jgi:lipopolysaccharide export system protein LptC